MQGRKPVSLYLMVPLAAVVLGLLVSKIVPIKGGAPASRQLLSGLCETLSCSAMCMHHSPAQYWHQKCTRPDLPLVKLYSQAGQMELREVTRVSE